jgi:hypothetical protein
MEIAGISGVWENRDSEYRWRGGAKQDGTGAPAFVARVSKPTQKSAKPILKT